jgi:hypothetical protein
MYPNYYLVKAHIDEIYRETQRQHLADKVVITTHQAPFYHRATQHFGVFLVSLGVHLLHTRQQVVSTADGCTRIASRPTTNGTMVISQCAC